MEPVEEKTKETPQPEVAPETSRETASELIRTILQDGVDFDITVTNPGLLHRLKILPTARTFKVYPINLGTLFNITKIINSMDEIDQADDDDLFDVGIRNINANKDQMLEILSLGILNRKMTPWAKARKWMLVRFMDYNTTPAELLQLINLMIAQMDVTDFLASSVSIRKLNLLEAKKKKNPRTQTIGNTSAG